MIKFGAMRVEGYASMIKEYFSWGEHGLNIIQAPNGSGKTTLINALVWCLYGKPLSGSVEPWEHIRPSSYCGTKVSQQFCINEIPYRVTRYKDYPKFKNSLVFEIDGDPQVGDKKELQIRINNTLGYSYELFKNAIIFGQKLKRIIAETGPNKKKVFDDAFEVNYIGIAKKLAEEKLKEVVKEYNIYDRERDRIEEKENGKVRELEAEKNMVENHEDLKTKEVKIEKKKIKEIKKKIEEEKKGRDIDKLLQENCHEIEILEKDAYTSKEIIKMEKKLTKLESKRDNEAEKAEEIQNRITELEDQIKDMPTKCDACGKPYTPLERKAAKGSLEGFLKKRKEEYQELIDSISILREQIKEQDTSISSATKVSNELDNLVEEQNELEAVNETLSGYHKNIKEHRDKIKEIKKRELINNIEKLTVELSQLQNELKAQNRLVRKTGRDKKTYEWLIKDPLSNSGLKAFIFNMMLDDINEKLEYYSSFIGFQVAFVMDMQSAHKNLETYVFKEEVPVPYEDLSGGQQQAVDIVTAFSIHDVIADTKNCSLLVMDEVFESLDRDNIEIMTELIQDKAQYKCLYLVTHQTEFNPTNANIIQVEYANGISSVA